MSSSTLHRSVRNLAACAHAHYMMKGITSIQRGLLLCNNITQEQCVKRSMKKKENGETKTFAVFHLVPLFIERGTSTWLAAE